MGEIPDLSAWPISKNRNVSKTKKIQKKVLLGRDIEHIRQHVYNGIQLAQFPAHTHTKKGLTWAQHGILLNFLRDNKSQTNDKNPCKQGKKKNAYYGI